MKQIKVKVGNLFTAIELLENIEMLTNIGYKQKSDIQIKNESNQWCDVPAIIKKDDDIIIISFSDKSTIRCGYKHKFVKDKQFKWEIFAEDLQIGDEFQKFNGEIVTVTNIRKTYKKQNVYDLEINSPSHIYQTPNGILNHNTLISALLTRAYKGKTLMIFDRIDLVHQTYEAFINEFMFDESEVGIIQGNNYKYHRDNKVILLSMMSYEKAMHVFPQIDVIQTDECFDGRTYVHTKDGKKEIQTLVNQKSKEEVLSFNKEKNIFEYKPIINWFKKENKELIKIYFNEKNNIKATANHTVYVEDDDLNIVEKRMDELVVGEKCVFYLSYGKGVKLSKKQYKAVLGMILGDSSISKSKNTARLRFSQGKKQKDYLEYKLSILKNLYKRNNLTNGKSGYNENNIVYATTTESSFDFSTLYDKVYINGKKEIKNIINNIDEISLAFWIMDNGSLNNDYYRLSTHSFSFDEQHLILDALRNKFNIEGIILEDKRINKYYLQFNKSNSKIISNLISFYVCESMQYKLFDEDKGKFNFEIDDIFKYAIHTINKIEKIEKEDFVYNIEVEDNHNYVVGSGLLVNNCHITGRTETAQKIIYSCQNASIHIGLSATPDRIDNPVEQLRLYSILGPIIYHKKIKEQQDAGFIADTKVEIYNVEYPDKSMLEVTGNYADKYERISLTRKMIIDEMREIAKKNNIKLTVKDATSMVRKYYDEDKKVEEVDEAINNILETWCKNELNTYTKEDGMYILKRFEHYGDESTHYILNDMRNDLIAEIAKKNKRVLVLFNKIKHGEELKKRLPDAYLIHGSHSKEERDKAQKALEDNEDTIVLASKIWGTGKNIPVLQTYINAGGGVSEIEQIQKMGRVIRLHKDKETAKVIDFDDRISPLGIKQSNKRKRVYEKENLKIKYL